jgi:branched-chain amino acid transport system permease protein
MDLFLQVSADGLVKGAVYALVAVGMTVLYGVMRIINFAHGDFFMVGLYLAFFVGTASSPWWGVLGPFVVVVGMAVAGLIFYALIRRILDQPELSHVMLTVGVSIVLQNLAQLIFSADYKIASNREASLVKFAGVTLETRALITLVGSIVVCTALYLLVTRSHFGRILRAVSEDRRVAGLVGVESYRVLAASAALGMACLGAAAYFMAPVIGVSPTTGTFYTLVGFVVVVVGGLGDTLGTLVAAVLVGLTESYGGAFLPGSTGHLLVYVLLFSVLVFRPTGVLGRGRAA